MAVEEENVTEARKMLNDDRQLSNHFDPKRSSACDKIFASVWNSAKRFWKCLIRDNLATSNETRLYYY